MFDPEWEDCPSCTAGTDELSRLFEHLHTRDTSYALVSRAASAKLERWKAKRGWDIPWYSSFGTDFNYDFGVTIDESVAPAQYNFRTKAEFEALGSDFFEPTSPSRCRAGAVFSKSAAACSTRTRSARAVWSRRAGRITSSTSRRSAARREWEEPKGRSGP